MCSTSNPIEDDFEGDIIMYWIEFSFVWIPLVVLDSIEKEIFFLAILRA